MKSASHSNHRQQNWQPPAGLTLISQQCAQQPEKLLPVTRVWGEDAITVHREFHRAVYAASHNDVMIKLLDDLWDKSDRYRRIGLELPSGDEPRTIDLNQHHQILELVIAGDGAGAAELARTHIANSLTASVTGALEERENVQSAPLEKTA